MNPLGRTEEPCLITFLREKLDEKHFKHVHINVYH